MTTIENAAYISRQPAWARNVNIQPEAIDYSWTAPTVPTSIEPGGEMYPVPVQLVREDMFFVDDKGVGIDEGPERIFVSDVLLDVDNARKLAAAILECCDQAQGGHEAPTLGDAR